MKQFINTLKIDKNEHLVFIILLIIYIILDIKLPILIADAVDTIYGKIVLLILSINIYANINKIAGILSFIATYFMIIRSSKQTGSHAINHHLPSEKSKVEDFSKYNDFPITLEEEEVSRMAPLVRNDTSTGADYKPVLESLHDAAPTDYEGVI